MCTSSPSPSCACLIICVDRLYYKKISVCVYILELRCHSICAVYLLKGYFFIYTFAYKYIAGNWWIQQANKNRRQPRWQFVFYLSTINKQTTLSQYVNVSLMSHIITQTLYNKRTQYFKSLNTHSATDSLFIAFP